MILIQQPLGSNLCGQACVAMVLGTGLVEATALVGKRGKTRTQDVIKALGPCAKDPRLIPVRQREVPAFALMKVTWKDKTSHWALRWGDEVYDPCWDNVPSWEDYGWYLKGVEGRVTSSLELSV